MIMEAAPEAKDNKEELRAAFMNKMLLHPYSKGMTGTLWHLLYITVYTQTYEPV